MRTYFSKIGFILAVAGGAVGLEMLGNFQP